MVHRHRFGRCELLPIERQLLVDGSPVALGARALDVLLALIERRDRLVTKAELLDVVWPGLVVEEANLPVQVSALRKVIGPQAIATIPGRGYRFSMALQDPTATSAPSATAVGYPAPSAAASVQTLVPAPLIGRQADVAALDALLDHQRLITVVGPGGVGKSVLAQHLLHRHRARWEQGAAWVDLTSVGDPSRVVGSLCAALGLVGGNADPLKSLLGALQTQQLLVALDNAEQVVPEVARVAQAIHDQAPGVRLIVTSQVPLKLAAEQVYRLGPLALPGDDEALAEAVQRGALALLVARARADDPRFELQDRQLSAAVEVCRRLDGLPLAIELAAARIRLFGLQRLASVLEERFAALGQGHRGAPLRQQTLRAAMQWSHGLLDADEQAVFRRLGVFAGSFSLDAAQQVLADEHFDHWGLADALSTLIERSLVSVDDADPPRYRLLETPRAYALECLAAAGEETALRARHAATFRALIEQACAESLVLQTSMDEWRARWLLEADNAHAAVHWAQRHDAECAVAIAAGLAAILGSEAPRERAAVLAATRSLVGDGVAPRVQALWHLEASFDIAMAQPALGLAWAERALEHFRAHDDRIGIYRALSLRQYCDIAQPGGGQISDADELKALELPQWPGHLRAQGANATACWHSTRGEFDAAIEWRRRALELQQQSGSSWRALVEHANLMDSLLAAGRADDAIACGSALEERLRAQRQLSAMPSARLNLAAAHLSRGDTGDARRLARDGWPQALHMGWQSYWADYLALLAALERRPRAAARLLGFADTAYATIAASREINEARAVERAAACCIDSLGGEAFDDLRRSGARLGDADIAALAFATEDIT